MSGFSNFLQQLNMGGDPMVTGSDGTMFSQTPGINPQSMQMPPQRERRSFLDTIGRISDVIARVGGADPLYQPTLDGQADRAHQVDLDAMRKVQMEQQTAMGGEKMAEMQRAKVGATVKGLQAIKRAGGDISRALPLLGERSGMSPEEIAALGNVLQSDANALDGLASMFGQGDAAEFGLQPFYAQDSSGKLQAYQLGKDGSIQPIKLGEGVTPIDPVKFVDVGDRQVGVGTRSGAPLRILPKGERPGYRGGQPINERPGFRGGRPIAPDPKGTGGTGGAANAAVSRISERIKTIRESVTTLGNEGALVKPGETGANLIRRARSSGPGQFVEGFLGTSQQEQRDRISQEADAIVAEMKEALKLTGTMMDRPQEYQRYKNIINNPNTTQANMELALSQLEKQFSTDMSRGAKSQSNATPARGNRTSGSKPSVSNW
jgi:hypothetical protein